MAVLAEVIEPDPTDWADNQACLASSVAKLPRPSDLSKPKRVANPGRF